MSALARAGRFRFLSKMANLRLLFSPRHMLALSVAINVSLVLKIIQQRKNIRERAGGSSKEKPEDAQIAEESQVEASSIQSTHPVPSPFVLKGGDADDGKNVINLDHGDPTMYERYWQEMGEKTTVVIPGWQFTSYFSDAGNLCWFLEPELAKEIARLHKVVGNAITERRHIVVGTGSSQLFQAALYALTANDASEPFSVVSAAPYYSSYPAATDCLKSGLYKWGGDARKFSETGPYIELVTSPNNPDGFVRESVVNRSGGILVHDLAYYWPQYTPITSAADYDLMLFTVSKSTGHAGMRIGWALVKDPLIAKKMVKYIELSTIGVSKDSQLRAAKVLKIVSDSCGTAARPKENFFVYCHHLMSERWKLLREAVKQSGIFSLPDFEPGFCKFFQCLFEPLPAFAWLKCEGSIEDCESFLKSHNIWTRSGRHFGVSPAYVRVSMLDRDRTFGSFVKRLSQIHL